MILFTVSISSFVITLLPCLVNLRDKVEGGTEREDLSNGVCVQKGGDDNYVCPAWDILDNFHSCGKLM